MFHNYTPPRVQKPVQFGPNPVTDVLPPEKHDALVAHIVRTIGRHEHKRRLRIESMEQTEIDLLGLVQAKGTDCEKKNDRKDGLGAAVPDSIYPFGYLSLLQVATQIAAVVFPAEAPYAAVAPAEHRERGRLLTKALRHQGLVFDHRNAIHASIFDTLALNCGALEFSWEKVRAMGAPTQPTGTSTALGWSEGMRIRNLDPYNVSWDCAVLPEDVPLHGEFFAKFDRVSPFSLARGRNESNFLAPEITEMLSARVDQWFADPDTASTFAPQEADSPAFFGDNFNRGNLFYYQSKLAARRADIIREHGTDRNKPRTDMSGLFGSDWGASRDLGSTLHQITVYMRLRPGNWGLVRGLTKAQLRDEPHAVWKFVIVADGYLAYAQPVDSEMDRLPIGLATMNYGKDSGRAFILGEHAAQLGLYISALLNLHKRAVRKGVEGGLTIFNPDVMNLNDVQDVSSGRVPAKMHRHEDDIRRHVTQLSDVPDTRGHMRDAEFVMGALSRFLPANAQPAMMGLDRATEYQAQAVMATSMQESLWYAALLDGQLLVPARLFMHYWNVQNAPSIQFLDEENKALLTLSGDDLKSSEFALVQGQPLVGIDRLRQSALLRDLVNILMQAGDQLPPVAFMFIQHYVNVAGLTISIEELEQAAARQAEEAAARASAEAGQGPGLDEEGPMPPAERAPITATR